MRPLRRLTFAEAPAGHGVVVNARCYTASRANAMAAPDRSRRCRRSGYHSGDTANARRVRARSFYRITLCTSLVVWRPRQARWRSRRAPRQAASEPHTSRRARYGCMPVCHSSHLVGCRRGVIETVARPSPGHVIILAGRRRYFITR